MVFPALRFASLPQPGPRVRRLSRSAGAFIGGGLDARTSGPPRASGRAAANVQLDESRHTRAGDGAGFSGELLRNLPYLLGGSHVRAHVE